MRGKNQPTQEPQPRTEEVVALNRVNISLSPVAATTSRRCAVFYKCQFLKHEEVLTLHLGLPQLEFCKRVHG